VVLARIPPAVDRRDDDGLHAAQEDHVLEGSLGDLLEQGGGALFTDLARYGIRSPKHHEIAAAEKDHYSHQAWSTFYQYTHAAAFHTWLPDAGEEAWMREKYQL
jgi:hypothetical protein